MSKLKITKQQAAPARRSCYAANFSVFPFQDHWAWDCRGRFLLHGPLRRLRNFCHGCAPTGLAILLPYCRPWIYSCADAAQSLSGLSGSTRRVLMLNPCEISGSAKAERTSLLGYFLALWNLPTQSCLLIMPPADAPPRLGPAPPFETTLFGASTPITVYTTSLPTSNFVFVEQAKSAQPLSNLDNRILDVRKEVHKLRTMVGTVQYRRT